MSKLRQPFKGLWDTEKFHRFQICSRKRNGWVLWVVLSCCAGHQGSQVRTWFAAEPPGLGCTQPRCFPPCFLTLFTNKKLRVCTHRGMRSATYTERGKVTQQPKYYVFSYRHTSTRAVLAR